jgi:predicted PurR-regulated permease PerM
MDEKTKSGSLVAFSLGALIGAATAVFALVFRRNWRSFLPPKPEVLHEQPEGQPASGLNQSPPARPTQGVPQDTTPARGTTSVPPHKASVLPATSGPHWTTPTKYIMGVILLLGALVVLIIGRGVIPIVILAALLALFINPFIQMLNSRFHLRWVAATAITYVLVLLVLLLIPLLVIPNLLNALNFLFELDYQQLAGKLGEAITSISVSLQNNLALKVLLAPLLDTLGRVLENFSLQGQVQPANVEVTLYTLSNQLAGQLGTMVGILGPVVAVVVGAILTLFMALQMSLAANQIADWYPDLIPPAYKSEYSALFQNISQTWISFLRGQLTLMLIIGLVIWLGGSALGVPYALLMGVIAGVLELIPNVGPTLAAVPAVLLALIFGSTYLPVENLPFALLVVGFYVLVQLLENQFIVPYVMSDAVDLPPLIVLIGTIAGASAFGILGALLATPIIASGNLIFQFIYRKILEPPPIPPSLEAKPSIWESVKGWVKGISLPGRKKQTVSAAAVSAVSGMGEGVSGVNVGDRVVLDTALEER